MITKHEQLARMRRELSELRARLGRIDGETFLARRQIDELEADLIGLVTGQLTEEVQHG